jgi:hypothetical protein
LILPVFWYGYITASFWLENKTGLRSLEGASQNLALTERKHIVGITGFLDFVHHLM